MSKLLLKFEDSLLQEKPVGPDEVTIGRSPDNSLVIDNPSVSHHHARVFKEEDRLMLEDFGSLNGTFVNGQRVKMVSLSPGDSVSIGKHTIQVAESHVTDGPSAGGGLIAAPPKIDETMMLNTKERREFLQKVAADGESSQIAPSRLKVATVAVRSGKTDQREYLLTDKLTVIGKSTLATIKLRGWFAPKVAAQISRREDNSYYIGAADKIPSVNGKPAPRPVKLSSGDVIEVAGIRLEFVYRD
jgi:FHA domain